MNEEAIAIKEVSYRLGVVTIYCYDATKLADSIVMQPGKLVHAQRHKDTCSTWCGDYSRTSDHYHDDQSSERVTCQVCIREAAKFGAIR